MLIPAAEPFRQELSTFLNSLKDHLGLRTLLLAKQGFLLNKLLACFLFHLAFCLCSPLRSDLKRNY